MELLDIMNERFSVRKYVDKPVEPEKLDKIFKRFAPHSCQSATCKTTCRTGRKVLKNLEKQLIFMAHLSLSLSVPTKQKHGNVLLTECRQPILTSILTDHDVRSCRTGTWNCLDLLFQTGCAKRGIQTS